MSKTNYKDLEKKLNSYSKHASIKKDSILKDIKSCFKEIKKNLNKKKKNKPDFFKNDKILEEITKVFDGRVGDQYDDEKLKKIYLDADDRYSKLIPPGFRDAVEKDKNDPQKLRKYGDIIGWFQIIDMAKDLNKPVIFVTDDRKDDWWYKIDGKTISPRIELIREIRLKASGVFFHMYNAEAFCEYAGFDKESTQEVKELNMESELNGLEVGGFANELLSDGLASGNVLSDTFTGSASSIDNVTLNLENESN